MTSTKIDKQQIKEATDNIIDTAELKALDALETARQVARNATDKVHALESELGDSVTKASEGATQYLKEKPAQAVGIAFAAGVIAAMLFRGR